MNNEDIVYTFKTIDNNYIIEFIKKEKSFFNTSYEFTCIINFKNIYGTLLKSISLNNIELSKLLDNLQMYLMLDQSIYFHIYSPDGFGNDHYIIGLSTEYNDKILFWKNIFTLYGYYNESIIKILSFDISGNLDELIDNIYNICNSQK